MNKLLGGILALLIVGYLWLNWPFSGQTTPVQAVGVSETATAVTEPTEPTVVPTIVVSNLALDENGNLLYLNSEWESIRENPETATGTVMVPAGRVIWGDRLVFKDCLGSPQDLKVPTIMALPCETQVAVTWGAMALEPEVTVELAKKFLDDKYQNLSGFPESGFEVFSKDGAVKSAP
jgi:hypothetical protein